MDPFQPYDAIGADLWATLPMLIVGVVGLVMVVVDAFRNDSPAIPVLAQLGLVAALVLEGLRFDESGFAFYGQVRHGGFASYVNLVVLLSALLSVAISVPYLRRIRHDFGEVYALVMFATFGMMVLGSSNSLVMIFVGLETMSVCLYVLTGLVRTDRGATESALKYFLLGAFSTGFFLYGIALLYGATGTMYLHEMAAGLLERQALVMFWCGVALLLIGFFFKISAVPFHMWTPDVYQGAPTTLTGFMATGSKAAAFAALLLVLWSALPFGFARWGLVIAVVAVITMVIGNVLALSQSNVKRMLAYSSIAHAGYVLTGMAAGSADGYSGALYYLLVYTLMNVGAFGVMALLEWDGEQGRAQSIESLAGIGYRRPLLGVAMAFFMFSLIGFPPLAGFIGKVRVFAPAIDAGLTWLVVIGVLMSAISAVYYLRVIYFFWMKDPKEEPAAVQHVEFPVSVEAAVVLVVCVVGLLGLGILPGGVIEITDSFFRQVPVTALP